MIRIISMIVTISVLFPEVSFAQRISEASPFLENEATRSADARVTITPFPAELHQDDAYTPEPQRNAVIVKYIKQFWNEDCQIVKKGNGVGSSSPYVVEVVYCNKKTPRKLGSEDFIFVHQRKKPTMALFGPSLSVRVMKCFERPASYPSNKLQCNSLGRPI